MGFEITRQVVVLQQDAVLELDLELGIRTYRIDALDDLGYRVLAAESGDEALKFLRNEVRLIAF